MLNQSAIITHTIKCFILKIKILHCILEETEFTDIEPLGQALSDRWASKRKTCKSVKNKRKPLYMEGF